MSKELELEEALIAGTVSVPIPNWQPIEIAPKDGTRILVAYPGYIQQDVRVTITSWKDCGWEEMWRKDGSPKFWMPLPDAPPGEYHGKTCDCDYCIDKYSDEDLPPEPLRENSSSNIVTIKLNWLPDPPELVPGWILIFPALADGNKDLRPEEDRIIAKLGLNVRHTSGGAFYASEHDAEAVSAELAELGVSSAVINTMWPNIWKKSGPR